MTIKKLAVEIAKREGKKSQARMGDVAEILGILSDIVWEEAETTPQKMSSLNALLNNGRKRNKRRAPSH